MFKQIADSKKQLPSLLRRLVRVTVCAASVFCFSAECSLGQDPDPFGVVRLELSEIDPDSDETTQLIQRSVRGSNPQTGPELAKAADIMMDIEQYRDAKYYLSRIEELGLNDSQLFDLNESIGSDFFGLIQASPAVQPEGKKIATKVLAAASEMAGSPDRIGGLIKNVNSKDISVRSESFRKLRLLGEPAVAELLNLFADGNRVPEYPGIRGVLKNMGPDAQAPLLGASRASDLQVQTEAVRALANLDTPEAVDVMMRVYLSADLPKFLRRIALDSLIRRDYPADPPVIEERLYQRSIDYLKGNRQVAGTLLGDVAIWSWDGAAKRMVSADLAPETAASVIAARQAADLYHINPDLVRHRTAFLLTQLEAAKRVVGPSRKTNVKVLRTRLNASGDEIEGILAEALKLELVPAAIACCELLEEIGTVELLIGSTGQPRPLVEAILFGDRYLQYAALQAIARIDPKQAYAGSSYLVALAVYLAQSENRPAGLVGHNREEIAQSYAAKLVSAGLRGKAVFSSRDFFKAITKNPDIEVLMVTDTLSSPGYAELIQQLRNDWRTRRMPIALLFKDIQRSQRAQRRIGEDPRFVAIPFSLDSQVIATHVQRLHSVVEPWRITNIDRRRHAAAAIQWLAKISNDRDAYRFYDLGPYQDQLARLLYIPGFSESASEILASLGTPTAQRELVIFASQNELPIDERQKAVEAFVKSVQKGGTLLTTTEIQQRYDRYNDSEHEPKATQKVLGAILDAIEARRKSD